MKRSILKLTGLFLALGVVQGAHAASDQTAAGTNVTNTATVNFAVGGVGQTPVVSNTDDFEVDAKIDLVVAWADTPNVNVTPGSTDQVLAFTVTNTGNAIQGVALALAADGADDFNMTNVRIYIEDGTTPGFDGDDTSYTPGTAVNAGDLDPYAATDAITVYIVSDTPDTVTDAQLANYILTATALDSGTAVGAEGTVTAESATNDPTVVDVIYADGAGATDAAQNGQHSATGTYEVDTATLTVTKSSAVIDDLLTGDEEFAVPGATVRYTILIENAGGADAFIPDDNNPTTLDGLVDDINDLLVTYTGGSVTVGVTAIADNSTGAVGGDTVRVSVSDVGPVGEINRIQINGLTIPAGGSVAITFDVVID